VKVRCGKHVKESEGNETATRCNVRFFMFPPLFDTLELTNSKTDKCSILVCVQVIDSVRKTLSKSDSSNKPAIEQALGAFCANKDDKLTAKEKKICYYLDPIKRDVAQPFSLGMPALRVCQRISKSNPEVCAVKNPVKTERMEVKDITKLRVKQLKQILNDRGVECKGCVEKEEFVLKVKETEHLAAGDEF
jgi:hypothetical protein